MTFLASKDEKLLISVLETVEAVLVDSSENLKVFENLCGVHLVCSILKQMRNCEEITHKCIELFTIYLHPEKEYPDYNDSRESIDKKQILSEILGREFVDSICKLIKHRA